MGPPTASNGFTLIETLLATAIVIGLAVGTAQLVAVTSVAIQTSGSQSVALFLAVQKIEQIKSLVWTFDPVRGEPLSDVTTDLTRDPPSGRGRGLTPTSAGALVANVGGSVDYLDTRGTWIGTGSRPPRGTAYIRRWSIRPLASSTGDTLALQVAVIATRALRGPPTRVLRPNDPGVTWMATLRTRR